MNPFPMIATELPHPRHRSIRIALALALGLALTNPWPLAAQAVTSAFTYQGELRTGGNPANANFDLEFRLFDAATGGTQLGPVVTRLNVPAVNGLFNVQLDFGPAQFAGDRQWLEVRIKPAGSGSYETLSPRTEVTATPYALGAVAALGNSVTTTSIVDGTIGSADIDATQIQRRVTGSCPSGQYVRVVAQDGTVTCGTDATGTGTVTSIATGAGLTGGPITTSGTIGVAPGGIGTTEINASQVQRRVTGTCTGTNYVQQVNADGTVGCGPAPAANAWSVTGNGGTNPATNFIGTTDDQPFVVRTRNVQSLRIEPSAELFGGNPITANVIAGSSANFVTPGVRGATIAGGGVPSGDSDPHFGSEAPNRVTDAYGTIGGGYNNLAGDGSGTLLDRGFATVGGGVVNSARGLVSTVSGGVLNTASGQASVIAGGDSNQATALAAAVGGGQGNQASANHALVAGGTLNSATAETSVIGGGVGNAANGTASTIAGGDRNTTSDFGAVVSGGQLNGAAGVFTTIGGGDGNLAQGMRSTIGGGFSNRSAGTGSVIAGGALNQTLGQDSAVAGGLRNVAIGNFSMVSGGLMSCAGAAYSWTGGRRAKVRPSAYFGLGDACSDLVYPGGDGDIGSFVWADSTDSDFVSSGANQFLARASGGFGFNSNTIPPGIEAVFRSRGGGDQNTDLYLRTASHGRGINLAMLPTAGAAEFRIAQFDGVSFVDRILLASNGDFAVTAQAFKPGGGSWAVPSDARLKSDVEVLSGALDRLLQLRGVRYEYRPEVTPSALYLPGAQLGFVAQEVEAVFPEWVSEGPEGYKTVGPRGFEALTVEALRELRAESAVIDTAQGERIAALEAENAALRSAQVRIAGENAELHARLNRLEALLAGRTVEER